ncbi:universal stress protein [Sphingobacterium thalpophilum]|uniref:Universal stress protein family n=1 Tax=Sphingobacterium thalpophilum TaxID=259 RepID=A0A4U9UPN7_9SPHI|nr:universal stress protein [Sphingobacterium thalpophilum]VTR35063.1 Universal stress protein family [Sphingobacterium thalpophilum]
MKNLLLLTDFSDNAYAAAQYAAKLAPLWGIEKVVLYHTYEVVPTVGTEPVVISNAEILEEKQKDLNSWEEDLIQLFPQGIAWKVVLEEYELSYGVNRTCAEEDIDLVVVGTAGKSGFKKLLLGSNTLKLIENCHTPLLVVPAKAEFRIPKKMLIATNLKEVKLKLDRLLVNAAEVLRKSEVYVVHVTKEDPANKAVSAEIETMKAMLASYQPMYSYILTSDIATGINQYINENHIDMMVCFHRDKGMLSRIFNTSIAQKMAWKSQAAMLVISV